MSSDEFADWMLYYEINPFGPKRGDIQAGIIASTVCNVNAAKGRRYAIKDFLPEFRSSYQREQRATMTNEQILAKFQELADTQKGNA